MHIIDSAFPVAYDVAISDASSSPHDEYWFGDFGARPSRDALADAVRLSVHADGNRWSGCFARGLGSFSAVIRGPTAAHVSVVAGGTAYVVPVTTPAEYTVVALPAVAGVWRVPEREVLLFANFSDVAAHGATGELWVARGLALDGLVIDSFTTTTARGRAEGDEMHEGAPFEISLADGTAQGGWTDVPTWRASS